MGATRNHMLCCAASALTTSALRWVRLARRCRTWSIVKLPQQQLWRGITQYEQTDGPAGGRVLTFGNERAVIGTGSVMADIAARFVPRADDLHIVTYPKAGTSWIQQLPALCPVGCGLRTSNWWSLAKTSWRCCEML